MTQFFINTEVNSSERVDITKFLEYGDGGIGFDPLTSAFLEDIKKLPIAGSIQVTNQENRPDLVSKKVYSGNTQYWWILLFYNNRTLSDEFVSGDIVTFPAIEDVEDLIFTLRAKQTASEV